MGRIDPSVSELSVKHENKHASYLKVTDASGALHPNIFSMPTLHLYRCMNHNIIFKRIHNVHVE